MEMCSLQRKQLGHWNHQLAHRSKNTAADDAALPTTAADGKRSDDLGPHRPAIKAQRTRGPAPRCSRPPKIASNSPHIARSPPQQPDLRPPTVFSSGTLFGHFTRNDVLSRQHARSSRRDTARGRTAKALHNQHQQLRRQSIHRPPNAGVPPTQQPLPTQRTRFLLTRAPPAKGHRHFGRAVGAWWRFTGRAARRASRAVLCITYGSGPVRTRRSLSSRRRRAQLAE